VAAGVACAIIFGEDQCLFLLGYARAAVGNAKEQVAPAAVRLPGDGNGTSLRREFDTVADDVDEDLFDLLPYPKKLRAGGEIGGEEAQFFSLCGGSEGLGAVADELPGIMLAGLLLRRAAFQDRDVE
jgi:hypothetical protein